MSTKIKPFWDKQSKHISNQLWFPDLNIKYKNVKFTKGKIEDTNINFESGTTKDIRNNKLKTNYRKIREKSKAVYKKNLLEKESKKCTKEIKDDKYSEAKHNRRVSFITKKVREFNTVTGCIKTKLLLTADQKKILKKWTTECIEMYNLTLLHCQQNDIKITSFVKLRSIIKNAWKKKIQLFSAPCCVLDDEIKNYCTNYKSALSNLENKNTTHFELGQKCKSKKFRTFSIQNKYITQKGFYPRLLGKIELNDKNISFENINRDCKVTYDRIFNEFYIYIPHNKDLKTVHRRHKVISLDPGEKIFMTGYSENHYVKIAEDVRKNILEYEKKIRIIQRRMAQRKQKNMKLNIKEKHKKKNKRRKMKLKNMRKKINMLYRKIKGYVHNLHNKSINFLVKNYDMILIPEFKTQNMIRNYKKTIREIKNKNENVKENLKQYSKKCRLNKRVKFVLQQLSHYTFRQRLLHKGEEYGCHIKVVTEEYTSKTCGYCGNLKNNLNGRTYKCNNCKKSIHRDINGARNILIKNYESVFHKSLYKQQA
jgi:transposase